MRKRLSAVSLLLLASAAMVLALSACEDMTTDQYHAQQEAKEQAQDDAVAGNYYGTATSLTDGNSIGSGIQIEIDAGSQPIPSSDGTTTVSEARMTGSVMIPGTTLAEASFVASYAPDTGVFDGSITIADESLTYTLHGNISGSSFSGKITSDQYAGEGISFNTTLNGTLPTAQGSSSSQPLSYSHAYAGSADCPNYGDVCSATMTINDSPSSVEDSFADEVTNVSGVIVKLTVNIRLSNGVIYPEKYNFGGSSTSPAVLNSRDGLLEGKDPTVGAVVPLNCQALHSPSGGWSCTLDDISFQVVPSESASN